MGMAERGQGPVRNGDLRLRPPPPEDGSACDNPPHGGNAQPAGVASPLQSGPPARLPAPRRRRHARSRPEEEVSPGDNINRQLYLWGANPGVATAQSPTLAAFAPVTVESPTGPVPLPWPSLPGWWFTGQ